MGLTKQYLRYASSALFGVVGSNKANIVFVEQRGLKGKYAAVPACEHVFIWDIRKGEKVLVLQGTKHEVTYLAKSPQGNTLAVGYADGSICLFNLVTGEVTVTFSGHKSAVTALSFDQQALRLVSGSNDTDVIVWDVVNESGLFRLKGHKGVITQCVFMKEHNILVTSSKDTFVKFWDLDTQHCFKTLLAHRTEVWDCLVCDNDQRLITGAADSELRVWDIAFKDQEEEEGDGESPVKKPKLQRVEEFGTEDEGEEDEEEESSILTCTRVGSVMRHGRERVASLSLDATGRFMGCHGPDSSLELFLHCTEDEAKKKLQKRQKRARKRQREKDGDQNEDQEDTELSLELGDQIRSLCHIKAASKIRSFDVLVEADNTAKLVLLLHNNTIETYSISTTEKKPEPQRSSMVSLPSHRSDVRTLSFSSDNTTVLSGSGDCVKIWNRSTLQCIRTMKSGYALCSAFVTGERHCIIGNKAGQLELFDIASGTILETIEAHEGAVWSISVAPDKKGFVTGSADKTLKFWQFELVSDEDSKQTSKRLTAVHTRTLQMSDDVLCVKYSPDQRLVAASLLDSTIKVFFADTLKFFLSLYGHKLPVLTMDISSDSTLLVSGSADRNIKLWGLDFGDCHKSIFAHDDSIMCVQFVPDTHLFFTGGKDKKIKQWDGDNFEHVQTLEGHHGEVWCLAISPNGDHVASSSHDKSLRLWERTEEPLVLQEEREMEREKEFEESIAKGEQTTIPGEAASAETGMAGKKTIETVKAAERIMEALELYKEETTKLKEHEIQCKLQKKKLAPPKMHPLLEVYGNLTPKKYFMQVLKKVKSSELEESLLVLPFNYILDLLPLLENYISSGLEVELCCRCLFFLLRIHHGQITSNQLLLPVIEKLRHSTIQKVTELRDTIGFNMAGLQHLQRELEAGQEVQFFADATGRLKEKKKKRKKTEAKAVLAMAT
ncbi:WD repeat-containing protein 3-like [Amphiura filiformis]|uniref:WD repeat-containing protein 3-like n=1 Tax=Amphiura filiformis TaxID=82378 RepID=UPI003B21A8FA